jgi:hypothetical protein
MRAWKDHNFYQRAFERLPRDPPPEETRPTVNARIGSTS